MRACSNSRLARWVSRQAQRATRRTPSTSTGFQPVPWHSGQSFCAIEVFQRVGNSVLQYLTTSVSQQGRPLLAVRRAKANEAGRSDAHQRVAKVLMEFLGR